MLLLPSANSTWNAACVGVLVCFWFSSMFLLYTANPQPPPPPSPPLQNYFENNIPTRTIFPSGSPVVPPPTTPRTRAPSLSNNHKKRGREDNIDESLLAPFRLGKPNNTIILNPVDHTSRPLPRCSDKKHGRGDFGSFPSRRYYSTDVDCLLKFDDSVADLGCLAMFKDHFAASYNAQGKLCRCGGIPLANSVCMFTTSVEFIYESDFDTTTSFDVVTPYCNSSTKWETGRFVDGRYVAPENCQLLDINPRSLQSYFPNKFIFIDGDSHQQDLFWGLVSEMRNRRYFAIPELPAHFGLGKHVRYEVGEHRDYLELLPLGSNAVALNDLKLRTCYRTQQAECTVFIYVFDRGTADYLRSAAMLASNPPDVLIGGFISRAYSRDDDAQTETKKAWEDIFSSLQRPLHFAWTSFPMNSMFIVQNMTEWVNQVLLHYPQLLHHFTLIEAPLWDALRFQSTASEPGYLTLQLTWHADCHMHVDYVTASESCNSPIPRTVYAAMLSIFATTT